MDLTGARWRKSSRSGGNGGDCVEVADNLSGVVGVRDSKDPAGAGAGLHPAGVAGVRRPTRVAALTCCMHREHPAPPRGGRSRVEGQRGVGR
ncbi:DUF397 domain-containing protein [Micromonospora zingiberis]|uniref:DUF397 domain-containing protein n=1 Tax=Micromonospora zingiberis TaxID=2053011 RepID=UPI003B830BA7